MDKSKILVTGAAGFIGSHVVDELVKQGHEVTALDDLSGGFEENVNDKAEFVKGSINDVALIDELFEKKKFDYVFHLAAYAAEGLSHFIKRFNHENNLIGSVNLINASINHEVKCFVFASSIAVYGEGQLPMREDTVPAPEDSYGISKFAVELELASSHDMFGLDYIIFRPHNVYGERQNIGDKYRNVIGIFMNLIMQNKPMSIFGDGKQQRAFSHIGDVAPVIANSIFEPKAYNQIFNIGADEPTTVGELAEIVAKAMGVKPEVDHLPPRNEVKDAYSDHEKVKKILNYEAVASLEEGVGQMAKWAKEKGVQKSQDFDNIEVEKNLPPSWRK